MTETAAEVVHRLLVARGTRPVRLGEGRFAVYVPGGGTTPDLEVTFAATSATRGLLARVRTLLRVPQESAPRALHLANRWNRGCVMPHAVLATRDNGEALESMLLLEAHLVPTIAWQDDQVDQFVEQVIAGARRFWSSSTVRGLCVPARGTRQATTQPESATSPSSPFGDLAEEFDG